MEIHFAPLHNLLGRLPWFEDLNPEHRRAMLGEVAARLVTDEASREEFVTILERWSHVAHTDAKWTRFHTLRTNGLLEPSGEE